MFFAATYLNRRFGVLMDLKCVFVFRCCLRRSFYRFGRFWRCSRPIRCSSISHSICFRIHLGFGFGRLRLFCLFFLPFLVFPLQSDSIDSCTSRCSQHLIARLLVASILDFFVIVSSSSWKCLEILVDRGLWPAGCKRSRVYAQFHATP